MTRKVETKSNPPCPIWWFLALVGAVIFGWLYVLDAQARSAEVERAVVRSEISRMVEDVRKIREVLERLTVDRGGDGG